MNHYRINFSQKDVDGRLFDGWTEVKAMSFDDAKNRVINEFDAVVEIFTILLFKRGDVPHDMSSGCCSS